MYGESAKSRESLIDRKSKKTSKRSASANPMQQHTTGCGIRIRIESTDSRHFAPVFRYIRKGNRDEVSVKDHVQTKIN